jgi:hypothetical protein
MHYKRGDRVLMSSGASGFLCIGTIIEPAQWDEDGDWIVASEEHGYAVARYEREMVENKG